MALADIKGRTFVPVVSVSVGWETRCEVHYQGGSVQVKEFHVLAKLVKLSVGVCEHCFLSSSVASSGAVEFICWTEKNAPGNWAHSFQSTSMELVPMTSLN